MNLYSENSVCGGIQIEFGVSSGSYMQSFLFLLSVFRHSPDVSVKTAYLTFGWSVLVFYKTSCTAKELPNMEIFK